MSGQVSPSFTVGTQHYAIDRYESISGAAKRPVVVVFHGVDGMIGASGTEIQKFAEQIASAGFLVFVPHYFDPTDGPDTLSLSELFERRVPKVGGYPPRIAAAVEYAVRQNGGDGDRLGLIGLSLGGGLALDYAESAPLGKVKALVDFFGYISNPAILLNAGRLPPTLILHNKKDKIVTLEGSSQPLLDALDKTTVPHEHQFYGDDNPARRDHPFLPGGPADVDSRTRSVAWLKTHL